MSGLARIRLPARLKPYWVRAQRAEWSWIGLRAITPCAAGLQGALLLAAPDGTPWIVLPAVGLIAACALGFVLLRRNVVLGEIDLPKAWLRRECLGLVLAVIGTLTYLVGLGLPLRPEVAIGAGAVGWAGGVGAMLMNNLAVWHMGKRQRPHYARLLFPWISMFKLGALGSWFMVYVHWTFVAWDQALVGLVILAVMVALLVLRRWQSSLVRADGFYRLVIPDAQKEFARLLPVCAWGGYMLPATLLALTIIGEGAYAAVLAWILLLLGDILWYYLLLLVVHRPAAQA